jgi:light-regulated signal transduction histidine kinase (bacteriophytochrome)
MTFAYIASHDLKEPLRGISNHARFLMEDNGDILDEGAHKRIDRIMQLCTRADRLISDLLAWSRLGRADMGVEPINVRNALEEIRCTHAEFLAARNALIELEEDLPQILGDRPHIVSVFTNLILNGIKYNDRRQPLIQIGFLPAHPDPDGDPRDTYFVRDNGIGIAQDFRETVFTIFKRLNSEKAYGEGTGAGLSFVQKIIEQHGGRIWLDSTPGQGSTFYFTVRRAPT